MKSTALSCLVVLSLTWVACGAAKKPTAPTAHVDTSCGLDCVAQKKYGLTVGTCFEYTTHPTGTSNPADLGVLVRPVSSLEDDVKVLDLEYWQSGQRLMTDSVLLTDGELRLARRSGTFGSFSYESAETGTITGVPWIKAATKAGDTFSTVAQVDVITSSGRTSESVTFRVNAVAPDLAEHELTVPAKTYDTGLKLIVNEQPAHLTDPQRIFVPEVGFVQISSRLGQSGAYETYRLQKVRTADTDCGLGSP
jgi:hypothetical protein